MAEALGKSVRQVKADMPALEKFGLIRHTRRRRNSNVYEFLWHPMFEMQSTALQQDDLVVQGSCLEVQDDANLEVQSTARESSPLESCPLNSEKADSKRISGDASQKQRSAASSPVMPNAEIPKDKTPKADGAAPSWGDPNPREVETPAKGWTQRELAEVRRRIATFWGREPEEGFEVSVMLRARGASAADVCDLFDRKYADPNCRAGGRLAPRSQNWFLAVIENEFTPGHLPECPSPVRLDQQQIESEVLNRGIAAIELPDAPRSIVESVRCDRCGGQALVRFTDGTIEGCACRDKSGGLERIRVTRALGIRSPARADHRNAVE